MSRAFTATFNILGVNPIAPGPDTFEVFAEVIDYSLAGYFVTDVSVGDIFFDVNATTALSNRYVVTQIIATGPSAFAGADANGIHLYCQWDDAGSYDPMGPQPNLGAIAAATPEHKLAEIPDYTVQNLPNSLIASMESTDNRYEVDNLIGADQPTMITLTNGAGGLLPMGTPVCVDNMGNANVINVSTLNTCVNAVGLVSADIPNGESGYIATEGRLQNVTSLTASPGDSIYVSKLGGLTNVAPQIGVGGFAVGDSIVYLGMAVKNLTNPLNLDVMIDVQFVAVL